MSRATSPEWWPRWRQFKDRCATLAIVSGGGMVLVTILMLFVFLVHETLPLMSPATLRAEPSLEFRSADAQRLRWLSAEEYGVLVFSVAEDGAAEFTRLEDGAVLKRIDLAGPGRSLTALGAAGTGQAALALGYSDGSVRIVRDRYVYTVSESGRLVTPVLEYPRGAQAMVLRPGMAVSRVALGQDSRDLAVQYDDGVLELLRFVDPPLAPESSLAAAAPVRLLLGGQPRARALHFLDNNRWLLLLTATGDYRLWTLETGEPTLTDSGRLFEESADLTASTVLQGGFSLVAASSGGDLLRYYVLGDGQLTPVHRFDTGAEVIRRLLPEHRRRGVMALGGGVLHWFNATSGELSLRSPLRSDDFQALALSPRADRLLQVTADGTLKRWQLDNPHPEVSFTSLWREVWYEGYEEPALVYQSSASSNDYESKFSLTPLAFGTLKAAFYAMLFAMPLAIGGAVYTAYFMAPALRRKIKPLIELMEALPTVILGFLAGLWLAPLVEEHLGEVLSLLLVVPLSVLLFAAMWSRLPLTWRSLVPDGWHAMVLSPVVLIAGWLAIGLGAPLEDFLFDGDARRWLTQELGLAYDQRNAMIVGVAMGFAVIPTIFSIAEDAIHSVPGNLAYGSLALGATPWQTLVGVVLPTASPGIFSGVMIGLGRAVGETMIVLMATGNTPIMDVNPFEGMRTLAANIAVEVPETEVDSTHYRILFLAAFVLFLFTFAVNTLAEVVRQRLRARYGALG